jgi:glycosyltransferase involved in cell wall biosynthesis
MDELFTVYKTTHQELGIPSARVLYNATEVTAPKGKSTKSSKKLIYLGGYDIRKQVPALIESFARFHKAHPEFSLELLGAPLHHSRLYPALPKHPAVHPHGFLTDIQIQKELQNGFALVHASDSEGFNLPLLEAMTLGVPAVVRDLPINREISEGKALFWKPSKKQDFTRILEELMDPKTRKAVIGAQKKTAQKYSWEKSAKLLTKTLQKSL